MTKLGVILALLVALGAVLLATTVRFTGPGQRTASVPETAATNGPLVIPVRGVAAASLVDSWADPRGGGTRQHHAIDIPAPIGTPVLAASDGTIEKLFTSALGGLTIYERAPDRGTVYYYAHLDRYAPTLAEGQSVRAGQVIASVGASGDADEAAPHLHFEVHRMPPGEKWWQGTETEPYPLLRAARPS